MAQRRRRKRGFKKWLPVVLFLVLFVVVCVVLYFVWDGYFREDKKDESSAEIIIDDKDKEDKKDEKESESKEETIKKEEVVLYEGEDPNTAKELTGVITYAGVNNGSLMVRVNIDQYLDSGSCNLDLMKGENVSVYSDTANIVSSASTATCEGFNVPLSGIGSGNYQIIIRLSSGGKTGMIVGEANI